MTQSTMTQSTMTQSPPRMGKLHIIDEVCPLDFSDDLRFLLHLPSLHLPSYPTQTSIPRYWMIDENFIEFCCLDKLVERREAIQVNHY